MLETVAVVAWSLIVIFMLLAIPSLGLYLLDRLDRWAARRGR